MSDYIYFRFNKVGKTKHARAFAIEEKLQSVIYDRFGLGDLSDEERRHIEDVDDTLLHYEFAELMNYPIFDVPPIKATDHDFSQRDFTLVEQEFLSVFAYISSMRSD